VSLAEKRPPTVTAAAEKTLPAVETAPVEKRPPAGVEASGLLANDAGRCASAGRTGQEV